MPTRQVSASHLRINRRWLGSGQALVPRAGPSRTAGQAASLAGWLTMAPLGLWRFALPPRRTAVRTARAKACEAQQPSPAGRRKRKLRHMDTAVGFFHFLSRLMAGAHGRRNKPQRWEEELPHGIASTFQAKVESRANSRSS